MCVFVCVCVCVCVYMHGMFCVYACSGEDVNLTNCVLFYRVIVRMYVG